MLKNLLKGHEIILASGSPRRQRFFQELEIPVTIDVRPVEEVYPKDLKEEEITNYLATLKSEAFDELKPKQILITSDTIVYCDGKALGKPASREEAIEMIQSLSGREHHVITSVCFKTRFGIRLIHEKTRVIFSNLNQDEIAYYVSEYEPYDKAGGYAIQEWIGLIGIEKIEGSYFNVVGLPTFQVYRTLKELLNS